MQKRCSAVTASLVGMSVLALAFTGCGSSSKSATSVSAPSSAVSPSSSLTPTTAAKSFSLAGTLGDAGDPFYVSLQCGATKAIQAAGSTIQWRSLSSADASSQSAQNVNALLLNSPAGFLYTNANSDDQANVESIQSKGIPVIEMNSYTPGTSPYLSVYSAPADANVIAMAKLIAQNAGTSGSVAVMAGDPIPVVDARWKPMVAELHSIDPGLTILPTQYDHLDVAKTASIVSSLITANPNLKAIWDTTGPEGQGTISAVEAAGKQGKIGVYSFDGTPALVTALKAGTVTALLAQSPRLMGEKAAEALLAYLNAHASGPVTPASPSQVLIPTMVLTQANVNDPQTEQDYEYQTTCP